jgi:hypothetical protein
MLHDQVRERKRPRKETKAMKKTISVLSNLLLSSILLWGAPTVKAAELVVREAASLSLYCHMQVPEIGADTLSWDRRMLDEFTGSGIDFYGPCDHDLNENDEIKIQRQFTLENYPWGR